MTADVHLRPAVRMLVDLPYPAKSWIAGRPNAWRCYTAACRRLGWNSTTLGWHTPRNGPFAGIRIESLHANHLWAAAGLYEPPVSRAIVELLADRRIASCETWDVGAHRGLVALLAARHGASRVVAIELSSASLLLLRRELAANPSLASSIDIVHAAASATDGEVDVVLQEDDSALGQIVTAGVTQYAATKAMRTVRCVSRSLDSLVAERRASVGLLKIDVEGAEALVLSGARNLLETQHPAVVLEIHDSEAGRRCTALLRDAGYSCRRIDGAEPSALLDDISYGHIVATRAR